MGEFLNLKSNKYSADLDHALAEENFEEAIHIAITRGILQNRTLYRMDFNQKMDLVAELAKKVQEHTNTFKGFGFNTSTILGIGQAVSGSGMFGLGIQNKTEFKKVRDWYKGMSNGFSVVKGFVDEGNSGTRTITQNAVELVKQIQEKNKANMQQLQSSSAELMRQLKQQEDQQHRAKMGILGG